MAYKLTNNVAVIKASNDANIPLALRFMLDNAHSVAYPNTPKDTGDLRSNVTKNVIGRQGIISWRMNYAIYQEENQYTNYTTAGTGPNFAKNAVAETLDNADEFFRKARIY